MVTIRAENLSDVAKREALLIAASGRESEPAKKVA